MKKLTFSIFLICAFLQGFAQWSDMGSGISEIPRSIISISVVDDQTVWGVAFDPISLVAHEYTKSADGGNTWISGTIADTLTDYFPGNIFALDANTAWVIMINLPTQDKVKIFKTIDGGALWQEQTGEFNNSGHAFAALHFFNQNEGVTFGSPGTGDPAIDTLQIFRTNDGGDTWNRISPGELPPPAVNEGVWIYSGNGSYEAIGDNLWFVTRANRVFKTTDKGLTWQAFETAMINDDGLASIAFQDSLNGIVTATTPQQASRTTDGGETWSPITIPSSSNAAEIEFIPGTDNTYLISDGFLYNSSNLLITHDGGTTWMVSSYPPSMDCVQFISSTVGWGGTDLQSTTQGGMYKWSGNLDSLTSVSPLDLVGSISIAPNPSTGMIYISSVNNHQIDQVMVMDYLGRAIKVINLLSEMSNSIDLSFLPGGIYYISLEQKGISESLHKLIIQK